MSIMSATIMSDQFFLHRCVNYACINLLIMIASNMSVPISQLCLHQYVNHACNNNVYNNYVCNILSIMSKAICQLCLHQYVNYYCTNYVCTTPIMSTPIMSTPIMSATRISNEEDHDWRPGSLINCFKRVVSNMEFNYWNVLYIQFHNKSWVAFCCPKLLNFNFFYLMSY